MHGIMGKILWIDLSTQTFKEEQFPENFYKKYISGIGMAAYLLYKHIPKDADPLGPENILGFVSGLLTGSPSLFTGRWIAVGKSPLTGTWGDTNCGGYFSLSIKKCGYDGIFFTGVSSEPVYLHIGPEGPRLLDASDLWGKNTMETEIILSEKYNAKHIPGIACIGQAGENISWIAGISHDQGRMAARSGLGAVMGSKKLKAIVLMGAKTVSVAEPKKMKRLNKKPSELSRFRFPFPEWVMSLFGKILRNPFFCLRMDGVLYLSILKRWGTTGLNQTAVDLGDAPIKNWSGTCHDFAEKDSKHISPSVIAEWEEKKYHCLACPLGCGGTLKAYSDIPGRHKPEYETTLAFSGLLLNKDWSSIMLINDMLNCAGMDSISAGGTVGTAIEWYEQGLLTKEDTGGLELTWGNTQAIIEFIRKMIAREGIGDVFADGSRQAARKLKIKDRKAVVTAGGSEMPMHDPRLDPGFGLHASVDPTPGRHTTGAFIYYDMYRLWTRIQSLPRPTLLYRKKKTFLPSKESGRKSVSMSNFTNFYNTLGICMFGSFMGVDRLPIFEWTNAATGWDLSPEEYLEIGRRIQTLRQMFNIKHGIKPSMIRVNSRALGMPPLKKGPNNGNQVDLDGMRRYYWSEIGWDQDTGIPTPETIEDLGLDDLVNQEMD